jgi:hypothetical protein
MYVSARSGSIILDSSRHQVTDSSRGDRRLRFYKSPVVGQRWQRFTFNSQPMPWWDGMVHCERRRPQAAAGGDVQHILVPLALPVLVMASWALRPEGRRLQLA